MEWCGSRIDRKVFLRFILKIHQTSAFVQNVIIRNISYCVSLEAGHIGITDNGWKSCESSTLAIINTLIKAYCVLTSRQSVGSDNRLLHTQTIHISICFACACLCHTVACNGRPAPPMGINSKLCCVDKAVVQDTDTVLIIQTAAADCIGKRTNRNITAAKLVIGNVYRRIYRVVQFAPFSSKGFCGFIDIFQTDRHLLAIRCPWNTFGKYTFVYRYIVRSLCPYITAGIAVFKTHITDGDLLSMSHIDTGGTGNLAKIYGSRSYSYDRWIFCSVIFGNFSVFFGFCRRDKLKQIFGAFYLLCTGSCCLYNFSTAV